MKKIGIITFHASKNCGSMLQAYALQRVLNSLGCESEIIDYSGKEQRRMYSVMSFPHSLKELMRNIYNIPFIGIIQRHYADYEAFRCQFLNVSKASYDDLSELSEETLGYDIYITGSDQVWNIKAQDFDDSYFLPFVNKSKKYAYAVSLGATNITKIPNVEKYMGYINSFNGISVREYNAQKWIAKLYSGNVEICADPTFLLNEKEWELVIGEREVEGDYIFWYTMIYRDDIRNIVVQLGKTLNLPIYVIDPKEWSRRGLFLHGIKLAKNDGPSSYLSMVKNAKIVITSSFHGTVFCNIFKKNFWYINIHNSQTEDDRAIFLLRQLGLSERYVTKDEILKKDVMCGPTYDNSPEMDATRKKSFDFLQKCLND